MLLLVDVQLPPALAQWFIARGIEAKHLNDLGLRTAEDPAIWDYCIALSGDVVIVTKDEDFVQLRITRKPGLRLVWVRLGNCSNRTLLAAFDRAWPEIQSGLSNGTAIIEVVE